MTEPVEYPDFPTEKHYGKIYPGPRETNFDERGDTFERDSE